MQKSLCHLRTYVIAEKKSVLWNVTQHLNSLSVTLKCQRSFAATKSVMWCWKLRNRSQKNSLYFFCRHAETTFNSSNCDKQQRKKVKLYLFFQHKLEHIQRVCIRRRQPMRSSETARCVQQQIILGNWHWSFASSHKLFMQISWFRNPLDWTNFVFFFLSFSKSSCCDKLSISILMLCRFSLSL